MSGTIAVVGLFFLALSLLLMGLSARHYRDDMLGFKYMVYSWLSMSPFLFLILIDMVRNEEGNPDAFGIAVILAALIVIMDVCIYGLYIIEKKRLRR